MGNKKLGRRKAMSRRIRFRGQKLWQATAPPSLVPEAVRVIISTIALQNLISLVLIHSSHSSNCKNPNFIVDGTKSKLLRVSCSSCGVQLKARKDNVSSHNLSIADGFAVGALSAGIGYSVLRKLLITWKSYHRYKYMFGSWGESWNPYGKRDAFVI